MTRPMFPLIPPGRPIRCSAAIGAVAMAAGVAVSGCSLLFDQAPPATGCDARLPGTVAHFRVDGDEGGTNLSDSAGTAVATFRNFDSASGSSTQTIATTVGPGGCGAALQLEEESTTYAEVEDLRSEDVVSVDFWFYLVDIGSLAVNKKSLLGKDQIGGTDGDLTIFANQDEEGNHGVFLRLQSAQDEFYLCSETLEVDTWHHLAASFDGVRPRLFVDGIDSDNPALNISRAFNSNVSCLDQPDAVATITLEDNRNNWLWGASNRRAVQGEEQPEGSYAGGAIDELRLRTVPFTEEEAAAVFQTELE